MTNPIDLTDLLANLHQRSHPLWICCPGCNHWYYNHWFTYHPQRDQFLCQTCAKRLSPDDPSTTKTQPTASQRHLTVGTTTMLLQQDQPITHRTELQALATYLIHYHTQHQPPESPLIFHMAFWYMPLASFDAESQQRYHLAQPDQPAHACGFAACAIGHLQHAWPQTQLECRYSSIFSQVHYIDPAGRFYTDIDAIVAYFNLYESIARYLFGTFEYTDEQQRDPVYVGHRLQAFLDANPV